MKNTFYLFAIIATIWRLTVIPSYALAPESNAKSFAVPLDSIQPEREYELAMEALEKDLKYIEMAKPKNAKRRLDQIIEFIIEKLILEDDKPWTRTIKGTLAPDYFEVLLRHIGKNPNTWNQIVEDKSLTQHFMAVFGFIFTIDNLQRYRVLYTLLWKYSPRTGLIFIENHFNHVYSKYDFGRKKEDRDRDVHKQRPYRNFDLTFSHYWADLIILDSLMSSVDGALGQQYQQWVAEKIASSDSTLASEVKHATTLLFLMNHEYSQPFYKDKGTLNSLLKYMIDPKPSLMLRTLEEVDQGPFFDLVYGFLNYLKEQKILPEIEHEKWTKKLKEYRKNSLDSQNDFPLDNQNLIKSDAYHLFKEMIGHIQNEVLFSKDPGQKGNEYLNEKIVLLNPGVTMNSLKLFDIVKITTREEKRPFIMAVAEIFNVKKGKVIYLTGTNILNAILDARSGELILHHEKPFTTQSKAKMKKSKVKGIQVFGIIKTPPVLGLKQSA